MMSLEDARTALGESFTFFSELVHTQIQNLGLKPNARILDVGTGMGRAAITLALCGHQVLTGEPEEDHSEYAKQTWLADAQKVGADTAITYQAFNAEAMPFEDEAFDAVFMMGALHHMSSPAAAVSECIRVLAPSGVLCILEPTAQLVERARTRHPTHPDPADPSPLVQGLPLQAIRGEMFDAYVVRKPVP